MHGRLFHLPFLFDGPLDLDPDVGGRVLLVTMAAMVVAAPLGGRVSERIGVRTRLVTGPNQAAALSAVPARDSGVGSDVLSTVRYLGGLAGVSVISVWINGGSGPDVLAGHRLCIWI